MNYLSQVLAMNANVSPLVATVCLENLNFDLSTIGTVAVDAASGYEIGFMRVAYINPTVQCFHLAMDLDFVKTLEAMNLPDRRYLLQVVNKETFATPA